MSIVKKLYELQCIDIELKKLEVSYNEIVKNLQDDSDLVEAKSFFNELSNKLSSIENQKKNLEWDIDELKKNISQINIKLYGGNVKNPKELINLEQEINSLKTKLKKKEDELLDIMMQEEHYLIDKETANIKLTQLESDKKKERVVLIEQKNKLEQQISYIKEKRLKIVSEIDDDSLKMYEKLILKRGNAIVKIEQGRCQGCRLTLSMSEIQRARSGMLVQCSSCGVILYMA